MKPQPNISIVIPLYNKEKYLARTLESVLSQSYQDFEVIIINDGSTDQGASIAAEKFPSSKIRLINQENTGVSSARNNGALHSSGELIIFLDADDYWDSSFLEIMVEGIGQHNWAMCAESHQKGESVTLRGFDNVKSGMFNVSDFFTLFLNNQTGCPGTIVMKRKFYNKYGGFLIGLKNGEDVEMWLRLAVNDSKIQYCSDKLVHYSYAIPEGATMSNRCEDSLISFWIAMEKNHPTSMKNKCNKPFLMCFNHFANRAYRFYTRSGYRKTANYLANSDHYVPTTINSLVSKSPFFIEKVVFTLLRLITLRISLVKKNITGLINKQ